LITESLSSSLSKRARILEFKMANTGLAVNLVGISSLGSPFLIY